MIRITDKLIDKTMTTKWKYDYKNSEIYISWNNCDL